MSAVPWLLCPAARAEADRTGIVWRCEGRANHTCDGERTPYAFKTWKYVKGHRIEGTSEEPCCPS